MTGNPSLATSHPSLAAEWHPTKNGVLTPDDVTYGSRKKVWWKCVVGHEWEAVVDNRSKGSGCPYCASKERFNAFVLKNGSLAEHNPQLAAEWHPTKNGDLTPEHVTLTSHKKVWWLGACGHEWDAQIKNRSMGEGCPVCNGRKVIAGINDLETTHPEIAANWHPTKNGDLTPRDISYGSLKKVWWLGTCGHEWEDTPKLFHKKTDCPICSNRRVLAGYNDLETVYPLLAAEWHPTKNGDLSPADVTYGSRKKVWWKCKLGHEWEAFINNRSRGRGCPVCSRLHSGRRKLIAGYNDLASSYPRLALEWDYARNGDLTPDNTTYGSADMVWWICSEGHQWQASPNQRTNMKKMCPHCSGKTIPSED